MILEKAQILNFKNIEEASLEFSPGLNFIVGANGMGKSNLLEAIHFAPAAPAPSRAPEANATRSLRGSPQASESS